jgi:vacuolar-type H+-ATPase subunit I/STV1
MVSHEDSNVDAVTTLVHSPAALLTFGVIVLAAGLAIVLSHNVWSGGTLPVVVTLVGWLILIKGLLLVFLPPEGVASYLAALRYQELYYPYAAITLIIGAYLTYGGFTYKVSDRA